MPLHNPDRKGGPKQYLDKLRRRADRLLWKVLLPVLRELHQQGVLGELPRKGEFILAEMEVDGYICAVTLKPTITRPPLTQREEEVRSLACQDLTYKEIAAKLHISPLTVATHFRRIYSKLGLHSRSALRN